MACTLEVEVEVGYREDESVSSFSCCSSGFMIVSWLLALESSGLLVLEASPDVSPSPSTFTVS